MCSRNELSIILDKLLLSYSSTYGGDLVRVLLYGSYSRGDYTSDSDIDVVAIVKGERQELQQRLKKVWDVSSDLELEYGTIVSPTVIPQDEYEKYKDIVPYYRNISDEGVEISA